MLWGEGGPSVWGGYAIAMHFKLAEPGQGEVPDFMVRKRPASRSIITSDRKG